MKLTIKLCRYCPKNNQCDYRDNLREKTKAVLPNLSFTHNCPIYKTCFEEGDEVLVQLYCYKTIGELHEDPEVKWMKDGEPKRAVIIHTPNNNSKKNFAVAFFEPQSIYHKGSMITVGTFGIRANHITYVGKYTGSAFWENHNDDVYET